MNSFAQISKTQDVGCVLMASSYLAHKKRTEISLEVFFAGLYLGCFERLLLYFSDLRSLVEFAGQHCGLDHPVWYFWADISRQMMSAEQEEDDFLAVFGHDVRQLLEDAADAALGSASSLENRTLTLAHLLRAISKNPQFEICNHFVRSGLDLEAVQANLSGV
jgi:hypothetical protein